MTAEPGRPNTVRLLWEDPGVIEDRDLYWADGREDRAPIPPFTFLGDGPAGAGPIVRVADATGTRWTVKFGSQVRERSEVYAEIAASRIVWALGYFARENYFVPAGRIMGVKDSGGAGGRLEADGSFRFARFERRPDAPGPSEQWDIRDNRFAGTRELSGLHILMMLLGNWDVQPADVEVRRTLLPNGDVEERYMVSDWASSFGRMRSGGENNGTRWDVQDYLEGKFLAGAADGQIRFRNALAGETPFAVPIEHARWFAGLASHLEDYQVRRAFTAAGATAGESQGFSKQIIKRIAELVALTDR